ncbi:MAG: hypothetical protein JOZ72_15540 [Alphaproteobacteria bacterium]|nr:hypothetical protein [Alphaproteobacteria bacterium]
MNWSSLNDLLSTLANFSAVATALIAVGASALYFYRGAARRRALEGLLKRERAHDEEYSFAGNGDRTILYLMAHLAMSESEILNAAFSSRRIKRWLANDPGSGRSTAIYFQYDPKGGSAEITDYMNRVDETLQRTELWQGAVKQKRSKARPPRFAR